MKIKVLQKNSKELFCEGEVELNYEYDSAYRPYLTGIEVILGKLCLKERDLTSLFEKSKKLFGKDFEVTLEKET